MLTQTRSPQLVNLSNQLLSDMEAYLKAGGKITECPSYTDTTDIPCDEWTKMKRKSEKATAK